MNLQDDCTTRSSHLRNAMIYAAVSVKTSAEEKHTYGDYHLDASTQTIIISMKVAVNESQTYTLLYNLRLVFARI